VALLIADDVRLGRWLSSDADRLWRYIRRRNRRRRNGDGSRDFPRNLRRDLDFGLYISLVGIHYHCSSRHLECSAGKTRDAEFPCRTKAMLRVPELPASGRNRSSLCRETVLTGCAFSRISRTRSARISSRMRSARSRLEHLWQSIAVWGQEGYRLASESKPMPGGPQHSFKTKRRATPCAAAYRDRCAM